MSSNDLCIILYINFTFKYIKQRKLSYALEISELNFEASPPRTHDINIFCFGSVKMSQILPSSEKWCTGNIVSLCIGLFIYTTSI